MDFSSYSDRWNEGDIFYRVKTFCYNESSREDNTFLHALIGVFSEIVSDRERFNGEGFDYFAEHGQATLATRLSLGILRLPKANECCIFRTWVSEYADMRMYNECELYSQSGEKLVTCRLTSRTIDTKTLQAVPQECYAGVQPTIRRESCGAPECKKVVPAVQPVSLGSYPVRYCDIDTHHNMNNSRYTELFTDTLPSQYAGRIPREYVINHTHRVLPGDVIELSGEGDERSYRMFGSVAGKQCFASEILY